MSMPELKEGIQHVDEINILILDIDKTMVARGADLREVRGEVEVFRQLQSSMTRARFEDSGKVMKMKNVYLTTRPIKAFIDPNSALSPLLGVVEVLPNTFASGEAIHGTGTEYDKQIKLAGFDSQRVELSKRENYAAFLCEQGTVVLAPVIRLSGKFENLGNGWGVQVVEKYKPYCNVARKHVLEAIEKLNLLGNKYKLEEGTMVNVSVQRKDGSEMNMEEKRALMHRINQYLFKNHNESFNEIEPDYTGGDLDIFPKSITEVRKMEALDAIQEIINKERQECDKIRIYLADDSFAAVQALLLPLKARANIVKLLVPANADSELIRFAEKNSMDAVLSIYPTFLGVISTLYEAITRRKLSIEYKEKEKLFRCSETNPIIVTIGDYAAQAVDQELKDDEFVAEQSIARFTNCKDVLSVLKDYRRKLKDDEAFSNFIAGLRLIVSTSDKNANENQNMKDLIKFLAYFRNPDNPFIINKPIPVIVFNHTNTPATKLFHTTNDPSTRELRALTYKGKVTRFLEPMQAYTYYRIAYGAHNPAVDLHPNGEDLTPEDFLAEIEKRDERKIKY